MKSELSFPEHNTLTKCEEAIKRMQAGFAEGGLALTRIRDEKLYREDYDSFEEYCQEKWGWGRQRAYQLIEAAEVKESLPKSVNNCLQNEAQARALAKVPEAKREEVLKEAEASGAVTASSITEAAKPKTIKMDVVPVDKMGFPIPSEMVGDYSRAEEIGKELLRQASFIKCSLTNGINEGKDVIWRGLNGNSVIAEASALWSKLKQMIPYAVCPICQGKQRKKCTTCKQAGYVSEFYWKSAFPPETRAMREAQIKAQK